MSSAELSRVVAEAEAYSVGAMLLEPAAVYPRVAGVLAPEHFGDQRLGNVYRACLEAIERGETCDLVAVADRLAQAGQLEDVGWFFGLTDMVDRIGTAANVEAWVERVVAGAELRRVARKLQDALARVEGFALDDAHTAADEVAAMLTDGRPETASKDTVTFRAAAAEAIAETKHRHEHPGEPIGISTGWRDLDQRWVGLEGGQFIVVGARPSMGKTAWATHLALHAAASSADDELVVIFSTEVRRKKLAARGLAGLSGVAGRAIRTGRITDNEIGLLLHAAGVAKLWGDRLVICDLSGPTPLTIRRTLRRVLGRRRPRLVVVDHMHQMRAINLRAKGDEQMAEISGGLLAIAKDFDCPLVAMAQLSRTVESRPNKRPIMSDLRGSGAIEQDADTIAFLYRDVVYNENTEDRNIMEVISAKVRDGEVGTDRLKWKGESGQILDLATAP